MTCSQVERALRHTLKIPKHVVSDDEIQKVAMHFSSENKLSIGPETGWSSQSAGTDFHLLLQPSYK
eukprot:4707894-Amphidinium_carterae.1